MERIFKIYAVSVVMFAVLWCIHGDSADLKTLRVLFPFKYLRQEQTILNPANTDTIYEYYLLENLGSGLVRDDATDVRGYTGVIASNWKQLDSHRWHFTLRKELKWSDGSAITPTQIKAHFEGLKLRKSRHLLNFSQLESVHYEPKDNGLVLSFSGKTNDSVLHELSLADAVLTHPSNLTENWRVTSGAYSVIKYDPTAKILDLASNPNSALIRDRSPKQVHLFDLNVESDIDLVFDSIETDLFTIAELPFSTKRKALMARAPEHRYGHSNMIFLWKFMPDNPLIQHGPARQEFAALIAETFKNINVDSSVKYYSQLVSKGYSGALDKFDVKTISNGALNGKNILLRFRPSFAFLPELMEDLKRNAQKRGITIRLSFDGGTAGEKKNQMSLLGSKDLKGIRKTQLVLGAFSIPKEWAI